jgi:ribosomal-protein-alanine N-acetyltransferase
MAADYPAIARIQMRVPEAAQWPLGDYSNYQLIVACVGADVVGFCAWRQTAADEAELLNLAVHPEYREKGIGTALAEELRRIAKGQIFLEVEEQNQVARRLYERAGWVELGVRNDYYGPGRNAIVMKIRSC